MMLSCQVYAIQEPLPIAVKVESSTGGTQDLSYLDDFISKTTVIITNIRTNETISTKLNEYNEVMVDWANSELKFAYGDSFDVTVNGQVKHFIYRGSPPPLFVFYVDVTTPQPVPFTLEQLIALIIVLVGGAGTIIYIKRTNGSQSGVKNVNGKLFHSHKNVSGYHNPNTIHAYQPHKKGELYPKYSTKKNADGKYDYLGD